MIWLGEQISKIGRELLQEHAPGIPIIELVVMSDLVDHAPSDVSSIVQRTGYAQSWVSAAVASVVERGWAWTEADPADRRRTIVNVSEQARAGTRAAGKKAQASAAGTLLSGVPKDRQAELMGALEELFVALRERDASSP